MKNNNIRHMKYIGDDDWYHEIYKCQEDGKLYKNGNDRYSENVALYTCGNELDGELGFPIDKKFIIIIEGRVERPTRDESLNYRMLSRMQSDCKYYLGNGNRYAKHLWAGDEQKQIDEMKKIYNSFPEDKKPEWLTWEEILEYEKLMISK